ncbi:sulfate transporter 4.1, chloroplastic-like isoform X2 [Momordica charantia]|uniref:Sulfate transporter 4.1, chloroplastic-like isoform X2 n=1 Tax=Momordica charantia TaxID=3673 RepID=A0A6J1CEW7_MOMCH|nr:sulfate transporter 4.1, chloroplastic-like isoform X2 [Momordica charantia]
MVSVILAVLQIMKHLVWDLIYLLIILTSHQILFIILAFVIREKQGSTHVFSEYGNFGESIECTFHFFGVAILESVGIAKALAAKNGYELDSNQELFGLGVSNVVGSFFSAYPTTGSFSRSAVSHESGAKTGLSQIVTGMVMGGALLFLTPLFKYIPQCALAAIVISAVITLVDYDEAIFLWRIDKKDFLLWVITAISTLFLGIEIGVLIGDQNSEMIIGRGRMIDGLYYFDEALLGRLPSTTVYRNVQ